MEVSLEDLKERLRTLSDEELLRRLQAGTMTSLATDVALAELRSRGIKSPPRSEQGERPEMPPVPSTPAELVTLAQFTNPLDANVLRACLEAHGIYTFLHGEHLGGTHQHLSTFTGGMRLQVRSDQLAEARELMAAIERGDLALDDEAE